jgi:hypothetical protein
MLVVAIAAMQAVTGILAADEAAGVTATVATGGGLVLTLCSGLAVVVGALVVVAVETGFGQASSPSHD